MVGINQIGEEASNPLVAQSSNVLAWVQDTSAEDVRNRWQAAYRDVVILDAFNRPVARDNLTSHDLGVAQNYQALRNALLAFATPADRDKDGLPDDWELAWFGKQDGNAVTDSDGDGSSDFDEFAFASSPIDPKSRPFVLPAVTLPFGKPSLAVAFRRFSGGSVQFLVETSPDLLEWSASPADVTLSEPLISLHDGTGAGLVRYRQTTGSGSPAAPAGFIRVRPVRVLSN